MSAVVTAGSILELVRAGRVRTRRELQDVTGLSRSTLSMRMTQLTAAGYLRESGQVAGATGRPAKILSFNATGQVAVAVDLGAGHAHIAIVDGGGEILAEAFGELRIASEPDDVIRQVTRRVADLIARSGRPRSQVVGVGVGIPGPVRFETQRPNRPPLMPGWHDYPIAERLSEALGIPVFVDNDANLMALGESRVRYPSEPSLLFVKVGTGIGAGVILHGQPERGVAGGAGDIGHIRIVEGEAGLPCTCGATGCLATEASGAALVRRLRASGRPVDTLDEVARLLSGSDPLAVEEAGRAGRLLGEVLATSVALLNPAVLVLGGAVPGAGRWFVDAVRGAVFARTVPMVTRDLVITASELGAEAAIQGARHLVLDQVFSAGAVDARLSA